MKSLALRHFLRYWYYALHHGDWDMSWGDWPGRGPMRWGLAHFEFDGDWWALHMGPLVISVYY